MPEANTESARLREAGRFLADRVRGARLCLVLGSGLRGFAERLEERTEVAFGAVPHWPAPRVAGHGGTLVVGRVAGVSVACLTGRVHLYEGWTAAEVVRAVRTIRLLGVPRFLLTNAAGGIDRSFRAGDLMVIADHVNLTGTSPLAGPHEAELGPRFPDQSAVWTPALRARLHRLDGDLREGVYAGLLGPAYETPAEVRMLAGFGAAAVGMSTVAEATALRAMGAELAGVSLISNLAAGIADSPLDHAEVIAAGRSAEGRLTALLTGFCAAERDA